METAKRKFSKTVDFDALDVRVYLLSQTRRFDMF